MNHFFTRFAFLLAGLCLMGMLQKPVNAAPLSSEDQESVRVVIQAQLDAFNADNAEAAFEMATPMIREMLGNSGRLLALVREAYPMVYRASSVAYFKAEENDGTALQLVRITDPQSKSWLAIFSLEKQPDASRISGCLVTENTWLAT
jgi:hypothetical protein